MDWIQLAHVRDQWWALVNAVLYKVVNFLTSCVTVSFSRRTSLHGLT